MKRLVPERLRFQNSTLKRPAPERLQFQLMVSVRLILSRVVGVEKKITLPEDLQFCPKMRSNVSLALNLKLLRASVGT